MQGIELAHFRVAPKENTQSLSRYTTWLSNMSKTLRPLVDAANPSKPPRYPGRHVANAYLAEAERLTRATAASRVPAVAIESAKREARDHAVALGQLHAVQRARVARRTRVVGDATVTMSPLTGFHRYQKTRRSNTTEVLSWSRT